MIAGFMLAAGLLWFARVGLTSRAEQPRRTGNYSSTEQASTDKSVAGEPEPPSRLVVDLGEAEPGAAAATVEFIELPRPTKHEKKIREALDKPTRVDFDSTPIEKCIAELRDIHNIPIVMDISKIREEGVILEEPITLRAAGLSLRSILKLLLEPVSLTYLIDNDMLKITISRSCEGTRTVLRVYPVGDLYRGPQSDTDTHPGDLEKAIVKFVQPDTWEAQSGPGSIMYIKGAQSLAISQIPFVHEQILDFLRALREAKKAQEAPRAAEQATRQPTWRSRGLQRDEAYSLVGLIELDEDPQMDRSRLHEFITAAGGRIDNELGDDGGLRVNGKREDQPQLSEKTRYIVVGTIPQPADLSGPEQIASAVRIAQFLADFEDAARDREVRVVSLKEFLKYLGYERAD
ncbi:MAG TPA: hypothetical protein VGM05_09605 [Planctomycetaceae bacterium]